MSGSDSDTNSRNSSESCSTSAPSSQASTVPAANHNDLRRRVLDNQISAKLQGEQKTDRRDIARYPIDLPELAGIAMANNKQARLRNSELSFAGRMLSMNAQAQQQSQFEDPAVSSQCPKESEICAEMQASDQRKEGRAETDEPDRR